MQKLAIIKLKEADLGGGSFGFGEMFRVVALHSGITTSGASRNI